MAITNAPISLCLIISITILSHSASAAAESDVHDVLAENGLPRGLLPSDAKSYSLSAADGALEVELESSPCYVKFTDLVYYDKKITGKLTYGKLSDVTGIQIKKLFAWLPVTAIAADGNAVVLNIGFLAEKLPSALFDSVPKCRSRLESSLQQVHIYLVLPTPTYVYLYIPS